jgi:hypothetical protein
MPTMEQSPMRRFYLIIPLLLMAPLANAAEAPAPGNAAAPATPATTMEAFPKPSLYPKSWELQFTHGKPTRIVVQSQGAAVPKAYWYMIYTVTNNTDREQLFLPAFELATEDGRVIRNDINIPAAVFNAIKRREGIRFLEPAAMIGGELRLGPDQARDGVAIWPEPALEMGTFSIFVSGLSGEHATVKGPGGKDVILRKTLQLNYLIRGDDVFPGEDEVNENPEQWIMR